MQYEESFGAVVFYKDEFLLLRDGKGYWGLPKGHKEGSEDLLSAAKREVTEETGISSLRLIPGFKEEISYFFQKNGPVSKKVIFFLMEALSKKVTISSEHTDFAWLKLDDAVKRSSFDNTKKVLLKASEFLK